MVVCTVVRGACLQRQLSVISLQNAVHAPLLLLIVADWFILNLRSSQLHGCIQVTLATSLHGQSTAPAAKATKTKRTSTKKHHNTDWPYSYEQDSLRRRTVICMPPPKNVSATLIFNPMTLKTFRALPTHMMNICAKFHWNPSTTYKDIASHRINVNGRRRDGRITWKHAASFNQLDVPSFRLPTIGSHVFPTAGAKVWNSLPDDVTSPPSLSTFRRHLKTYL